MPNSSRFFANKECEYYPCHKCSVDINCLFCYCPLYALGENCGGNFRYTDRGIKSCENCAFPHRRENYERILARWPAIAALTERKKDGV